jgi:hypothetical protein
VTDMRVEDSAADVERLAEPDRRRQLSWLRAFEDAFRAGITWPNVWRLGERLGLDGDEIGRDRNLFSAMGLIQVGRTADFARLTQKGWDAIAATTAAPSPVPSPRASAPARTMGVDAVAIAKLAEEIARNLDRLEFSADEHDRAADDVEAIRQQLSRSAPRCDWLKTSLASLRDLLAKQADAAVGDYTRNEAPRLLNRVRGLLMGLLPS